MAVTATFLADFSTFTSQVDKATTQLRGFETGASKVEKALARVGDSYSGRKTIQDAQLAVKAVNDLGGVSKLTDKEQQRLNATVTEAIGKYRTLGQQAPADMLAIANATAKAEKGSSALTSSIAQFTAGFGVANLVDRGVRSLVSFGAEAVNSAGRLVDLAGKTGLSTETLQRMEFVAGQTGGSIDAMSDASYKLGIRIAGGSGSVKHAFDNLGLSLEQMQRLSPDEQWEKTAAALGKVGDATKRNQLGTELFGKSFSGIAANIASDYAEIAKAASVTSAAQIKALDDTADAWAAWKKAREKDVQSVLGTLVLAQQGMKQFTATQIALLALTSKNAAALVEALALAAQGQQRALEQMDARDKARSGFAAQASAVMSYAEQLRQAQEAVSGLSKAQQAELNAALKLGGESASDLEEKFFGVDGALSLYKDQQREATEATKKQAQAMEQARASIEKYIDEILKAYEALRKLEGSGAATAVPAGIPGTVTPDLPLPSRVGVYAGETMNAVPAWFPQMKTQIKQVQDAWGEAVKYMRSSTADAFGDMLTGLRGFKDGMLDIWRSIQQGISRIISDMVYKWLAGLTTMGSAQQGFAAQAVGGAAGGLGVGAGGAVVSGGSGGGGGAGGLFGSASRATGAWGQYGIGAVAGGVAGLSVGYQTGSRWAGAGTGALTGGLVGFQYGGIYGAAVGAGVGAAAGLFGAHLGSDKEKGQVAAARDQWLRQYGPNAGWDIQNAIGIFGATPNKANLQLWRDFYKADSMKELDLYTTRLAAAIQSGQAAMQSAGQTGPIKGTREGIPFYAGEAYGLRRPHLAVVGDAREPENVVKDSTLRNISGADAIDRLAAKLDRYIQDQPRQLAVAFRSAIALSGRGRA